MVVCHGFLQQPDTDTGRANHNYGIATARDHQGGCVVITRAQMLEKIEPCHARHVIINEKTIRFNPRLTEKIFCRGVTAYVESIALEQQECGVPHGIVVVNDNNNLCDQGRNLTERATAT